MITLTVEAVLVVLLVLVLMQFNLRKTGNTPPDPQRIAAIWKLYRRARRRCHLDLRGDDYSDLDFTGRALYLGPGGYAPLDGIERPL